MTRPSPFRRLACTVAIGTAVGCLAGCSDESATADAPLPSATNPAVSSPSAPSAPSASDTGIDVPLAARESTGGGGPRPPAYWAVWNTCAPDNRADEARANGWTLADDLLADPGVGLGDYVVPSCEQAVAILEGASLRGETTSAMLDDLAAQLLAAEFNMSVGAELCPAAEEAIVGAQLVLSSAQYAPDILSAATGENADALPALIDLLRWYNTGELCL